MELFSHFSNVFQKSRVSIGKGHFMSKKFEKHFRYYFKSNHPVYIIGEKDDCYIFHRITSSPKSGHHRNWKVFPNPDKKRTTPMYIVKVEQIDKKKRFGKRLKYNQDIKFTK